MRSICLWLAVLTVTGLGCASTLHEPAARGDLDRLNTLTVDGADVNARDDLGWTPLFYAVERDQKQAAEFLIDRGADLTARDNLGRSALDVAAQYNLPEMALVLIDAGAAVDATDPFRGTALHYAATKGNLEVIEILLARGAEINARERIGWTPLDLAVNAGKRGAAELLASRGGIAHSYAGVESLIARQSRESPVLKEKVVVRTVEGALELEHDSFSEQTTLVSTLSIDTSRGSPAYEAYRTVIVADGEDPERFYQTARAAWLIGPWNTVSLSTSPQTFPAGRLSLMLETPTFYFFKKNPAQLKIGDGITDLPNIQTASEVGKEAVRTKADFLVGREAAEKLAAATEATLRVTFSNRPTITWEIPAEVLKNWKDFFQKGDELFSRRKSPPE